MDPRTINYLIACQNESQSSIARQLRVSPAAVSSVIAGRARSKKIENRIARALNLSRHQLWPQWYDEQDEPIKQPRKSFASAQQVMDALKLQLAA